MLVNEDFATAHRLAPGDRVLALVNGRRVALLDLRNPCAASYFSAS